MIKSFRHKGLALFYRTGNTRGIQPAHAARLRMQLSALNDAVTIADISHPGFRLHSLKGKSVQTWSVRVSANWRLTFRFIEGHIVQLDYEDYH